MTFIGPPPDAIDAMGSKSVAKTVMSDAGVPVCPGYHGEQQEGDFLKQVHSRWAGYGYRRNQESVNHAESFFSFLLRTDGKDLSRHPPPRAMA